MGVARRFPLRSADDEPDRWLLANPADPSPVDDGATPQTPLAVVAAQALVQPSVPTTIVEPQLYANTYGSPRIYGSNIPTAWRYATGAGVTIAMVDEGFDASTAATYGNFSTALSRSFAGGAASNIGEPSGGFHGTTTSGLIGASGINGTPMGLAPNATIVGVKVSFTTGSIGSFAQALQYAASVGAVVNNSWGYTGYGIGEPGNRSYTSWYTAVQGAVQQGRSGLGSIITFSAGNDRANANNLAVQPITADYRVIAVAASDMSGTVATYSNPGAALLVAAIGNAITVPKTGGSGTLTESGTSYSAPTVAAIAAMMLAVNPSLGWRDVQEILADSACMPATSASGFVTNGNRGWNGGGMHFSNDLGFGVIDANVAVNLARAWTAQSTSANMVTTTATHGAAFSLAVGATILSTLTVTTAIRVQHVQVTINDTYLPVSHTQLVLIAPDGTRSVLMNQTGMVSGRDLTNGLDVSGSVITSNAFWGDTSAGTWTLQVQDSGGRFTGTIQNWSLTFIGDAATVAPPLVFTPEFASLALANPARAIVATNGAATIDLIALPATTSINLNSRIGMIDGISVMLGSGLRNANADGSTGTVTLTGRGAGGSILSGGDGISTLTGVGGDTFNGGLGTTTINTGKGGSTVTLSNVAASAATIWSGGGDTIWAGLASATITVTGGQGDTVYAQGASLSFINGSGASTVYAGSGSVLIQAGLGGGTYYAGTAGNSRLMAGAGQVTFHGMADGDVLTAAGAANDALIAGAGTETLSGGTNTGNLTLVAGTGATTMIAGLGRTVFVLGPGNDSITVGGVANMFQIQNGKSGGFDTISGFRLGLDDLSLSGFGSDEIANALSSQSADGMGGTLLMLSDTTRLDLLGIAAIDRNAFV